MLGKLKAFFGFGQISEQEYQQEKERILSEAPVPVFWLFGKTGSGKTSVVKYLTGAEEAEIGNGFMPQTEHVRKYDFPDPENPLLSFLDTRGLGEGRYDPAEDIRRLNEEAQLMLVTARVMDHALEDVVAALRQIRAAKFQRPVLLVLTCLHEAYPQQQHPHPDPFDQSGRAESLPADLQRSLERQRQRFEGLVDRVVPVDLTKPEEGLAEPNFGGQRLKTALVELLPTAYRQTLLDWQDAMQSLRDLNEQRAMPYVVSYSMMAATAAAVPAPWIDIPVVMALQSHLIYRLRGVYGQQIDTPVLRKLAGAVGGRLFVQLMLRGTLKLVPFVGIAANAAMAYAYTYGLGKACCWYFGQVRAGNAPSVEEVEQVWRNQIVEAARLWSRHRTEEVQA